MNSDRWYQFYIALLLSITAAALIIMLLLLFMGCTIKPAPALTPPETYHRVCIDDPPPLALPFVYVPAGKDGCPTHFAMCMRVGSYANLRETFMEMSRWEDLVWIHCGDPTPYEIEKGRAQRVPVETVVPGNL